jgi:alkylation response protein AidB-like acyl-CoA dehydrogenase
MDLSFSPEELAFREEVRDFIANDIPAPLKAKADGDLHFEHHEMMEWHKVLYRKGWVAPQWPKEYGGPGLSPTQRFLLTEELELVGMPHLSPFGLAMVGPLLMQFGTEEQKQRFLPKILSGDEVWCQGYSEPNAGSDLASLQLRAEDDGQGNFILNGQKTWTTYAQHAHWIFLLCRTDPRAKKQAGISFLLAPMNTPGIIAKPMLTIGHTPAFAETFFENALVPKENLVGGLHQGWTIAKALLGHERTLIAGVGISARYLRRLKRIAASTMMHGKSLLDDPSTRAKIARLEMKLRSLQMTNYRAIAGAQLGHAPGPESSILKLRGSEIQQQALELAMEIMGHHSLSWYNEPGVILPFEQSIAPVFNYSRATTIYGGSNEIQKNIIAKMILGLPS